jgi:NADH-quinone oxidoreductase subunit N
LYIEFNTLVQNYCLILSGVSVIYGSLISLYQTSFKRLLAYGSMVHIGLIIFSISLYTPQSITAGIFYLFSYIILMLFTFSFMLFLFEKDSSNNLYYLDDISKFHLYFSNNIILSTYFVLIIFSLAGLPFFIGFIAKWYIFISLIDVFNIFEVLIFLSISVLSSSYYIRILRFIYFSNKHNKVKRYSTIIFDNLLYNLMFILLIINIITIVYHSIIFLLIFQKVVLLFI